MNTKLVDSLVQVILSLSQEERTLLEKKLFFDESEPSTLELMQIALIFCKTNQPFTLPKMENL